VAQYRQNYFKVSFAFTLTVDDIFPIWSKVCL